MDRIKAAQVFVSIIERGSMVAAGRALDMSRSMVTRYLAEMENWSNSRLLHRSTRRLSLTPAGENVLEHCRNLLKIADNVAAESTTHQQEPAGLVRISCAQFVAEDLLASAFASQLQQHFPRMSLDIHVSNKAVDMVEERIDLAIRITNDLDPNLIARKLGECHSTLCASPDYLQKIRTPTKPEDLTRLNCLTYTYFGSSLWQFQKGKSVFDTPVQGTLSANESGVLLKATLAGCGISLLPKYSAAPYIKSERLVELLPHYTAKPLGIHGVYRSREHMSLELRTVIDELVTYFGSLDL